MSEKFKCYNSIQYVKKHKSSSNLKLPTTFFFLFFFCAFYYVSNALHHFLLRYFRDFFTIIWISFFFLGRVSLKTCFDGFPYFNKKDFFLFVKKKIQKDLSEIAGWVYQPRKTWAFFSHVTATMLSVTTIRYFNLNS